MNQKNIFMLTHQHSFIISDKKGYELCTECGTYHSKGLLSPDELYKNNYWNGNTRSLMKDQVINLTEITTCGVSKIDKILQYVDTDGDVLEIACAPGILMNILIKRGNTVLGIEPDSANIPEIRKIIQYPSDIIEGYFPDCLGSTRQVFDYIITMDCVEHIEDYKQFFNSAKHYLIEGGKFIFMSPIIYEDGLYREIDFIPHEHAWIFTKKYLQDYLSEIFSGVTFDRWVNGHEICVCTK